VSDRADPQVQEVVDRATIAAANALLAAETDKEAVGTCPFCGEMLTIANRHADHLPPLCPEWARYIEEWTPPGATP